MAAVTDPCAATLQVREFRSWVRSVHRCGAWL